MVPEQNVVLGAISPTLFIGLGGTGKEVLLRLRRKFYERIGRSGLPCTSYLWLDTDTRDVMALGEKVDEIYQTVTFSPQEEVALLSGSVGDDLAGVFRNKGQWKHILDNWLYDEVERFGAEIADGAGGVRSVGRLTFFYHFANTISNRIRDALNSIGTHEKINETRQLFRERAMGTAQFPAVPTPQVFVISSVAGGTGCGTLLDTVFFLRHLSQRAGIPIERIVGIIFMPNVFFANAQGEVAQRSYGNAYAALKELEFYTLRLANAQQDLSIDYSVEWEAGQVESVQGPPFSVAYIEEMKNEGGIPLEPKNRSEMFSMVAESLYLDFMPGAFSTQKRSHYSNIAQYLSGPQGTNVSSGNVVLPQVFARRYASFGMSKIEIPIDALKGACAAKLSREVLSYMNRSASDPNIRTSVLDDMARYQLDARGLMDRLRVGWRDSIRDSLDAMFRGLTIKDLSQVNDLEKRLQDYEKEQVNSAGSEPTKWGAAVSTIRRSTKQVSREVNEAVEQWLVMCLESEARGLKSVVDSGGYLEFLGENLRTYYTSPGEGQRSVFDTRKESAQKDAEAYQREKQALVGELKIAVKSIGIAGLAAREWSKEIVLGRLKEAEKQYCLAKAEECALDEAIKIATGAVDLLNEKKPILERFGEFVSLLTQSFQSKYEGFINFADQVLFIRIFDYDKDWDAFYKLDVDDNAQPKPVDIKSEYRRFLEGEFGGNTSLWNLVDAFYLRGEHDVKQKLSNYSEKRFWRDFDSHPREINVLEHPEMRERWAEYIERMVRSAMPMIRRNTHLGGSAVPVQRLAYLGVADTQAPPYNNFIAEVQQQLAAMSYPLQQVNIQSTGKPWEVYLYLVCYAFPLPSLPIVVTDCHKAYWDFYKKFREQRIGEKRNHIPLHLSKAWEGKFEDLLVYGDAEARQVKEAREILLFGALLRVLDLTERQGRALYAYKLGAPHYKNVELGAKIEATEVLRNDPQLRDRLMRALNERETNLSQAQLEKYYWAIQFLIFSRVYAEGSPESTLLEQRLESVHGRLQNFQLAADSLALDDGSYEQKAEKAKTSLANQVTWIGSMPILLELTAWTKASAEGA